MELILFIAIAVLGYLLWQEKGHTRRLTEDLQNKETLLQQRTRERDAAVDKQKTLESENALLRPYHAIRDAEAYAANVRQDAISQKLTLIREGDEYLAN